VVLGVVDASDSRGAEEGCAITLLRLLSRLFLFFFFNQMTPRTYYAVRECLLILANKRRVPITVNNSSSSSISRFVRQHYNIIYYCNVHCLTIDIEISAGILVIRKTGRPGFNYAACAVFKKKNGNQKYSEYYPNAF